MEDEATPGKNASLANTENLNKGISGPWNEELQRSYEILVALMSTLAPEQRGDLVELLKIIAEECVPRKSIFEAIWHELENRTSDRRQGDRRQDERRQDEKRHEERRLGERRQGERRQGERRQFCTHSHTPWTANHIYLLEDMASQNLSIRQIALRLGRTSSAIETKAKELDIPLSSIE